MCTFNFTIKNIKVNLKVRGVQRTYRPIDVERLVVTKIILNLVCNNHRMVSQ